MGPRRVRGSPVHGGPSAVLKPVTVIDLFAGPGGLGEGFSSFRLGANHPFRVGLSVEKDEEAHRTLRLRAFFRQFPKGKGPVEYYEHLRGALARNALFKTFPEEARAAAFEAVNAELGVVSASSIDRRIRSSVGGQDSWVLIGGPPCQAYSLAGRSRMRGENPRKFERDARHFLYKEYLRILATHLPPVFVMENVKGLLSSRVGGQLILQRICTDLSDPLAALGGTGSRDSETRYRLYSFRGPQHRASTGEVQDPSEFILQCEDYGIPQARHRLVILGVRSDLKEQPKTLRKSRLTPTIADVIGDLPRIRSRMSKGKDSPDRWARIVMKTLAAISSMARHDELFETALALAESLLLGRRLGAGAEFIPWARRPGYRCDWFRDWRLGGVCNHSARAHIDSDLQRYFFVACFAASMNGSARSPVLADFPKRLLPKHANVEEAIRGDAFGDRFRVQIKDRPATTITSHISKDGHYYIHYDPLQCRSLTVREAARIQTFPDNYFFSGSRTSQYHQVGNAVPPLLAYRLAGVVHELLARAGLA